MKKILALYVLAATIISCNDSKTGDVNDDQQSQRPQSNKSSSALHYRGALTGGMKGDSIFFDVRGNKLENLTFKGYWYCDGKLTMERAAGPEGYFMITDNKVDDHISEPPNGGASAWRFDLKADIRDEQASGSFRMNINGLGCNTGTLEWTAIAD